MSTIAKQPISGASNGLGIKVVATATAGTLIHTAVSGTTNWDEIWLYAVNSDTVSRLLTIEYGGVTSPDNLIQVPLASQAGLVLVVPGLLLQNGLVVRAFAAAANVVCISGFVNRITV